MRPAWNARAHSAFALCFVAVAGAGIGFAGIITPTTLALSGVYVALACAALAMAATAAHVAGWRVASMLVLVWLAGFLWFEGVRATGALIALVLASVAVGSCLRTGPRDGVLAAAMGLVVLGAATGWALTWPVHASVAWWFVVVVLVAWRRRHVLRLLRAALRQWRVRVASAPRSAALAVLALGLASTSTWLPNLQADDLTYHLQLPVALLHDAAYQPDVQRQLWAFAPWLNDTLHGVVAALGGEATHAPLNCIWLSLVGAFAWRLMCVLGAPPSLRWFGVALAASIPMLVGVAMGMHTELPATALTLGLCATVLAPARPATPTGVAWLAGGLFALKSVHLLTALPWLALWFWRIRTQWRDTTRFAVAIVVCASAYAHAWWATGNPVFPLLNGVFRSTAAPLTDLRDSRWQHAMDWRTPWHLVFDTSRFLESGDGALGISVIGLLGGALSMAARREWRIPLALGFLLIAIPFAMVQYARYVLPGVVCFSLVALAASGRAFGTSAASPLAAICMTMHLLLLPAGNWLMSTSALARYIASNGDDASLRRKFLPASAALARIPVVRRGNVLSTDPAAPYVASFGRHGLGVSWYSPALQAAAQCADRDASGDEWLALFLAHDVAWVMIDSSKASAGLRSALRRSGAVMHAREGQAAVWRLPHLFDQARISIGVGTRTMSHSACMSSFDSAMQP